MGYIHVEIGTCQSSKTPGAPCGDVVTSERTPAATTLVCADGLGSGIKANIAATMCSARLLELLRQGASLRNAFAGLVKTMNAARGTELPYAVFTVLRVLNDGEATVLSYEMPGPILVGPRQAAVLPQRTLTLERSLIGEANCHLEPGEGLAVMSDGITQAGMGMGLRDGWGETGVCQYINSCLADGARGLALPHLVHSRARELWKTAKGDDCTVAMAACRWGKAVTVLTGPPADLRKDRAVVNRFLQAEGTKVVCGATTAKIVAKHLGQELQVEQNAASLVAPPRYMIDGIDLVTEGAVTLNQVYNILDEDPASFEADSGVTALYGLLQAADRVDFIVGGAQNPANSHISFSQRGILPRSSIIPLISAKLRNSGKLAVVEQA